MKHDIIVVYDGDACSREDTVGNRLLYEGLDGPEPVGGCRCSYVE